MPRFLLLLTAFRPLLQAVHTVSKFVQTVQIDIAAAMVKIECLKSELRQLRSDDAWKKAQKEAYKLAGFLEVDIDAAFGQAEEEESRKRKRPKRIDEHPETKTHLSPLHALRFQHYFKALDKLIAELEKLFPNDLRDFKFLEPANYFVRDAEDALERLRNKYSDHLKPDEAVAQWRIFRHTLDLDGKGLSEIFGIVPDDYESMKTLHQTFLPCQSRHQAWNADSPSSH